MLSSCGMISGCDAPTSAFTLRGTLKDMLRDAGVTREANDFITGHSQGDEAGKYESGPSLETKYRAVNLVEHPWLTPALGKASNRHS